MVAIMRFRRLVVVLLVAGLSGLVPAPAAARRQPALRPADLDDAGNVERPHANLRRHRRRHPGAGDPLDLVAVPEAAGVPQVDVARLRAGDRVLKSFRFQVTRDSAGRSGRIEVLPDVIDDAPLESGTHAANNAAKITLRAPGAGGSLPITGPGLGVAAALLAAGAAGLLLARRRTRSSDESECFSRSS